MSLLGHSGKALSTTISVLAATVVAQGVYEVGTRVNEFARNQFTLWNLKNNIKTETDNISTSAVPKSGL